MSYPPIQTWGSFTVNRKTAAGATAFAQMVRPSDKPMGQGVIPQNVVHLTTIIYESPNVRQNVAILRPLNYTTFSAVAAASQAVVSLTADPGVFSTNWKYPGSILAVADDPIISGDYVMYQAADGTWVLDTAAGSYSAGTLTLTTNLPTGGVKVGGLFYFFGVAADKDPRTGDVHVNFDVPTAASGTTVTTYTDPNGLVAGLAAGDPLIIYSNNATTQGYLQLASGFYAAH